MHHVFLYERWRTVSSRYIGVVEFFSRRRGASTFHERVPCVCPGSFVACDEGITRRAKAAAA